MAGRTMPVANAPLSYGAFEATVGHGYAVPDPDDVLEAMARAGYAGTELGPPGFLGEGEELRRRLERVRLELVAGFVPLHLTDREHRDRDLRELERTLDLFEAAGAARARPLLADAGGPERLQSPGRAAGDARLALDRDGWASLVDGVRRAAEAARGRGFEPAFHHHGGSYVEAPAEIERLLEDTDVPLLLDTGHLALGGGDPVRALRDWGERVGHVHVKDVRLDLMRAVVEAGGDMVAAWERGVFCELGDGDVELEEFLDELARSGYRGWLVVEQDRVLSEGESLEEPAAAQGRNLRWLRERAR